MKKWTFVFIAIAISIFLGFLVPRMMPKPGPMETALRLSGPNRAELERVLEKYGKKQADSLQLRAAQYLISNCYIHSSQSAWFEDSTKKKIDFFPPRYGTSPRAKVARDSLHLHARYVSTTTYDCQALHADFLTAHIDSMVGAWQSAPWKKSIPFSQFCRYMLPYRVLTEAQSPWPHLLAQKYKPLAHRAGDIVSAARAVNEALAHDIRYNRCWIGGGLCLQSVPELISHQSGMCDDLGVYGVCAMRACGIPSTVDFTIWAKANLGHSWAVVFDEKATAHSFGPGEQNPGEHKKIFSQVAHRKLAKVFRRSFEINQSGLWNQVDDPQSLPSFFQQRNLADVTSEYTPVYDISIPLNGSALTSDLVFICIYNTGRWTPVHWTRAKKGKATFTGMGDDLLYVAGQFEGEMIHPVSPPFVFDKNQQILYLGSPDTTQQTITFHQQLAGVGSLINNPKHYLFQWIGNDWDLVQEVDAQNDSALTVHHLRASTLYKFEDRSRPFTIANNTVLWW